MRIGHVITRLIVGGAQENTLATCRGLRQRGHDVDLILGPQTGPEGSLLPLVGEVPVTILDDLCREPNPWRDWRATVALTRLFREGRYDIVHTHSGKAGILGRLAARLAGVPVTVHTIHGPSFHDYQNPLGNWVFRWAEQVAAEWTTQFVSVADAMTAQYQAAGVTGKYVMIRSGIDWEAYGETNSGTGVPPVAPGSSATPTGGTPVPRSPVVGMVARLFPLKGHEFLFAAVPAIVTAVPAVKFLLVGDGPWRERFEQEVRARGWADRFTFAGLVPPREVPRFVGQMSVLVHLSLREGLPRAVVQALAAGKPVVAFDVAGAREVCVDGKTGFLLRAGDVAGVAAAVIRLLRDAELAGRMGAQGRTLVCEQFAEAAMVERIEQLYRQLVGERR
jgi:glycosyltransferase involved in cell wall biosynthesis